MGVPPKIQLREFCEIFQADERQVRYILEEGHVPKGVSRTPSTGNRREFDPSQAFWLAIVLKLKHSGLKTPLAATVADYANEALRTVTQNLSWDWHFLPLKGWFDTEHQYFVDIGDLEYIRLVTDSCPSRQGLYEFDWHFLDGKRRNAPQIRPYVMLRVDLTLIADVLKKVEAWANPDYSRR